MSAEIHQSDAWPPLPLEAWFGQPAFFAYAYPAPSGFSEGSPGPEEAFFAEEMGEFILPYDAVRTADDPDAIVLEFMQATYELATEPGDWDREALEREPSEGARLSRRLAL